MDFRFDGHVSNAGDEDSKDNFLPGWSALSQAGLEGMHELIMVKMLQDGLGHCVNPSSPHRSSNKCVEVNQCRKRFRPHIVPNDKELKLLDGIILQNRMLDGTAESDHVKHLPAATQPMCQDHCRKLLSYARELESKVALLSEFKNRNEMLEKSIEESKLRELRMAEQVTALSTSKSHLETQVDKLMQCKQECDQYRIRNDELTVVCHRHSQIIKQILYDKEQLRQQQRAIGEKLCIGKPDLDVQVLEMKRALDELALGHTQILEKQRLAKVEAKALTQNEYDQKLQGLMNIYESQLDQLKDQLKDVSEYRTEIDFLRTELRNKGNQHKEAVFRLVAVQSKRRFLSRGFQAWKAMLHKAALFALNEVVARRCSLLFSNRRFRYQVQLVFRAWQSLYLSTKRTRRLMMACMRCLRLQTLRVCLKQWMRATRYVHMQGKVLIALMQTAKQKRFFRAFSQWKSSTKSEKTLHFQELCVARKCKSLYARRSCRRGLKCFQTWRDLNRREKARRAAMRRCIVRIIKRRLGKSWRQWRRTLWHEKLKDQAVWSLLWSKKKRTVYSSFRHWWTIIKFMKVSRFQRKIVAQLVSFKQKAKRQILLKSWKWCTDVEATKYKMARFLMELRKQKTLSHSFSRWRLRLCKESLSLFRELTLSRAQFRLRNTNMSRAKRMVFGSWKLFFCFRKTLSIKCRRMCFCLRMLGLRRSFSTWFSFSEYWRHTLRAAQYFQAVSRRIQQTGAFQKWVLFLRRRWMEEKQGLQELSVTTSRRFRAASLIFFFTQRFWQRKMNAVLNTMNRCVQECRHQRDFLRYNLCCLLQRKLVRTRSLAFRKWKWAARRMVKHKFPIYQVSTPKPRPIKWR